MYALFGKVRPAVYGAKAGAMKSIDNLKFVPRGCGSRMRTEAAAGRGEAETPQACRANLGRIWHNCVSSWVSSSNNITRPPDRHKPLSRAAASQHSPPHHHHHNYCCKTRQNMSHDQAVKAASAKHNPPSELVGKFQYGTAGVSLSFLTFPTMP